MKKECECNKKQDETKCTCNCGEECNCDENCECGCQDSKE